MCQLKITRVILYVKDVPRLAAFYQRHFGMLPLPGGTDKWTELTGPAGSCTIALHKASTAQKSGSAMKLVFGVENIEAFKQKKAQDGLIFGPIHRADGVEFANAKDPAGNSIQISNRALKTSPQQANL